MPPTWRDLPPNDWVALNAKLRGLVVSLRAQGVWTDPIRVGAAYLWADSTGALRIKTAAPTSDTDGTIVGTQT